MTAGFWTAPTGGLRRWYAALAGIAWWMVHLVAEASLVRVSCQHEQVRWLMHGITLITAAATIVALVWSARLLMGPGSEADQARPADGADRAGGDDEFSRDRFLGLFGIGVNAISLLLILWEGSYVIALSSCASY